MEGKSTHTHPIKYKKKKKQERSSHAPFEKRQEANHLEKQLNNTVKKKKNRKNKKQHENEGLNV